MEKTAENFGVIEGVGTRLREWRQKEGLKGYQLAEQIHLTQGSLSDIENNNSLPSAETLTKLYKYTQVNIIWLLTNKGPMAHSFKFKKDLSQIDMGLKDLIHILIKIFKGKDQIKKTKIERLLNSLDN